MDRWPPRAPEKNPESLVKTNQRPKRFRDCQTTSHLRCGSDHGDQFRSCRRTVIAHKFTGASILNHWQVRYFIRYQQWPDVLRAISKLPPEERGEIEWTYWTSRALTMTGSADLAVEKFQKVAQSNSRHRFLSADFLGVPYDLRAKSERPPETLVDA